MITERQTMFWYDNTALTDIDKDGAGVMSRVVENGFNGDLLADNATFFVHSSTPKGGTSQKVKIEFLTADAVANSEDREQWVLSSPRVLKTYDDLSPDANGFLVMDNIPRDLGRYFCLRITGAASTTIASICGGLSFDAAGPRDFKPAWRDPLTKYTGANGSQFPHFA